MCVTKVFHLLTVGLTPRPKFTKRGDDPKGRPSCQISSPCVNRRRRYPLQKFLQTHTQTVNNISPACLLACGDNNTNIILNNRIWHNSNEWQQVTEMQHTIRIRSPIRSPIFAAGPSDIIYNAMQYVLSLSAMGHWGMFPSNSKNKFFKLTSKPHIVHNGRLHLVPYTR